MPFSLDAPLRVTWSALPGRRPSPDEVAAHLTAAGVLEVQLRADLDFFARHAGALAALSRSCRVEVLVDAAGALRPGGAGLLGKALEHWQESGGQDLGLAFDCSTTLPAPARLAGPAAEARRHSGVVLSLAVVPDAANLRRALELAKAAPLAGFGRVQFLHPDLTAKRRAPRKVRYSPLTADLLAELTPLDVPGVELFVHDPFLAQALLPGPPGSAAFAGCQAADALAHLDSAGTVYPCSALPFPLGSLQDSDLARIWASEERRLVRQEIERLPAGCADCDRRAACRGGCRGLALALTGRWDNVPACLPRHNLSPG